MKKKVVKQKRDIKKPLMLILALVSVLVGTAVYKVSTYDATAKPKNDLIKRLQHIAAHDASSKASSIRNGADIATLQKDDQYNGSSRAVGVIDGPNKIYWNRVLYDKWETGGGFNDLGSGKIYGCYRLTADTVSKTVDFEPKACSSIKDLPAQIDAASKEVTFDKKTINNIRDMYNDNVQCYPGGNALYYQCKKQ